MTFTSIENMVLPLLPRLPERRLPDFNETSHNETIYVSLLRCEALSKSAMLVRSMRWFWFGLSMMAVAVVGSSIYQSRNNDQTRDRDLEVRLDFIPFQPRREFRDSLAMTLRGDGKVRVVHHRREMYVDDLYEGTLPEADALRLVASAKQARSELNLLSGVLSGTRDDSLFRMVVLPAGSPDEKSVFGGNVGDASESTHRLLEELLVLSNRLTKVPDAEAYLRSIPFLQEELKRIHQHEQRLFLPVGEISVALQPVVNKSLSQPRDFIPITRTQHDQLLDYRQFIITNNGFNYRLSLSLPTPVSTN